MEDFIIKEEDHTEDPNNPIKDPKDITNPDGSKHSDSDDKSKAKDEDSIKDTEITIDGTDYKLDAEGNAINTDGSLFMTKEKILEYEQSNDSLDVTTIMKEINYIPKDETGKEISYENSIVGIKKYVEDYSKEVANSAIEEFQSNLFATYPIMQDVYRHLQIHGNIDTFKSDVNYETVTLKKDNVQQLRNVVIEARTKKGDSIDEAEEYVRLVEDDDKLYDAATKAKDYLIKSRKEHLTKQEELIKQQRAEEERKNVELANLVKNKILTEKSIKIKDKVISIPDNIKVNDNGKIVTYTREQFYDYIYKPIKVTIDNKVYTTTKSEYDKYLEDQNRGIDDELFDIYKRFVKYDTSQMIEENLKKKDLERKKKIITTNKNLSSSRSRVTDTDFVITDL